MTVISDNFASLVDLDPVLTEIFYQHYGQAPDVLEMLFGGGQSSKAKETDQRIGSFRDPREFQGKVEYQTPLPDYEIEYTHTQFADGFTVERAMLDDMQYDGIFQQASSMGTAFSRKRKKDRANIFNNAFTTAGYDAVSLCNDSHPRSSSDTDNTIDNALALPLNSDNLETAITTMQAFGDDLGEEINIMPNILLVPRGLRRTGRELTESELTPESAENAINVHDNLQLVVSPFLTSATTWFVIDGTMAKQYLKWYDRIPTEFAAEDDFNTLIRQFRGYMRYVLGWSDWRWVIGSVPA